MAELAFGEITEIQNILRATSDKNFGKPWSPMSWGDAARKEE